MRFFTFSMIKISGFKAFTISIYYIPKNKNLDIELNQKKSGYYKSHIIGQAFEKNKVFSNPKNPSPLLMYLSHNYRFFK
ncbi:hypothetical protein VN0232_05520 [Helicobacter pylori]|nr:hypothetical protein VN0232_05520 [Helicobacter pylori]